MTAALQIVLAVLASSVVAALVAGLFTDRNDRRKQLRDQRVALAGDFAGLAMAALAAQRDYKPTTNAKMHFNQDLHHDTELRYERSSAAKDAINQLRPLRGRVWILFPVRSPATSSPNTTSDWAESVIGDVREVNKICRKFWGACDDLAAEVATAEADKSAALTSMQDDYKLQYDAARSRAWASLDGFTTHASRDIWKTKT